MSEPMVVDIDVARRLINWQEERTKAMVAAHLQEVGELWETIGALKEEIRKLKEGK